MSNNMKNDAAWLSSPYTFIKEKPAIKEPIKPDPQHEAMMYTSRGHTAPSVDTIALDVQGCQFHIQKMQYSIENVRVSTFKLGSLLKKSGGMDWKTKNKEPYEKLIEAEVLYFEKNIEMLLKLNQYVNYCFNTIVENDKKLQNYIQ